MTSTSLRAAAIEEAADTLCIDTEAVPDFAIIGAPKCGTTALHSYLSSHNSVFMPRLKEPSFFCSDISIPGQIRDSQSYLAQFSNAPAGALKGEASVWYLFSAVAVEKMMQAIPRARIIVMLRRPDEAARSFHRHCLRNLSEDIDDFEEAWNAQDARAAGRRLPRSPMDAKRLQYRKVFSYPEQLRRVFAAVPEAQRLVVIYEEFFAEPERGYAAVLKFLGLAPDGRREFPVLNEAKRVKSKWLARRIAAAAQSGASQALLRKSAHALSLHPLEALTRLNEAPAAETPLRPAFETLLRDHFAFDIAAVERKLGRRLECWH